MCTCKQVITVKLIFDISQQVIFYTHGMQKEQRVYGIRQGWIITPSDVTVSFLECQVAVERQTLLQNETRDMALWSNVCSNWACIAAKGWVGLAGMDFDWEATVMGHQVKNEVVPVVQSRECNASNQSEMENRQLSDPSLNPERSQGLSVFLSDTLTLHKVCVTCA